MNVKYATSTERQESPEKLASNEALEKLACEALAGMVSDTFSTSEDDDDTSDTKSPETVASDEALGKVASDEALEKLVLYVISCGGKRDSLEGWSATHSWHGNSGKWLYVSKEGEKLYTRPQVARRLKLPGAPKVGQSRPRTLTSSEALQELASYVVSCGGTRDLVNGWSARRYSTTNSTTKSETWHYLNSKEGQWFASRPEVARWLELPGAPMLEQRIEENIASPEECKEALEKLACYCVLCGGKRDLLEGWSARRDKSKDWHYYTKNGTSFKSRPDVARWLNLPGAPEGFFQASKKRKR
jgi:hypothetical protein